MQVGFVTDQCGSKKENEDSFLVDMDWGLFIVADGLGGHNAGKLASQIATEEIALYVHDHLKRNENPIEVLEQAILHANTIIAKAAYADQDWRADMGTTVVAALLMDSDFFVANVGDSRAYFIRKDHIEQLSQDHTFVADWVEAGTITAQEARSHKARHGIWMALGGGDDDVRPHINKGFLDDDSCLLLCSDGLSDVMQDQEILELTQAAIDPQDACKRLLHRAQALGAKDHVTVVLLCNSLQSPAKN